MLKSAKDDAVLIVVVIVLMENVRKKCVKR